MGYQRIPTFLCAWTVSGIRAKPAVSVKPHGVHRGNRFATPCRGWGLTLASVFAGFSRALQGQGAFDLQAIKDTETSFSLVLPRQPQVGPKVQEIYS